MSPDSLSVCLSVCPVCVSCVQAVAVNGQFRINISVTLRPLDSKGSEQRACAASLKPSSASLLAAEVQTRCWYLEHRATLALVRIQHEVGTKRMTELK